MTYGGRCREKIAGLNWTEVRVCFAPYASGKAQAHRTADLRILAENDSGAEVSRAGDDACNSSIVSVAARLQRAIGTYYGYGTWIQCQRIARYEKLGAIGTLQQDVTCAAIETNSLFCLDIEDLYAARITHTTNS
jgi:hypothetical protein